MWRSLGGVLAVVLVLLLAWAGYAAYQGYQSLASRVSALEAQVQAQGETLKTISERLAKVEEEVFKAPVPPISMPEPSEVTGSPAWPYVAGLLVLLVVLFLVLRLLKRPNKEAPEEVSPSQEVASTEEARMVDEGASPKLGEEGKA